MNTTNTNDSENKLREKCVLMLAVINERKYAFPFRKIIQPYFKKHGLPGGNGITAMEKKYHDVADNELLKNHLEILVEVYQNSILYGVSGVMFFQIKKELVEDIYQKSLSRISTESPYTNKFPFPLTELELKEINSSDSYLLDIDDLSDFYCLRFCHRRYQKVKEKVTDEEAKKLDVTYEEVYGLKTTYSQAFDRVFINKNTGDVFFCIDKNTENELTEYDISYKVEEYRKFLEEMYTPTKNEPQLLQAPTNLYPAIKKFYDLEEGEVIELNHLTSTNSNKAEKMRVVRGGNQDLRVENFHQGGLKNITRTSMFLIKKQWTSQSKTAKASIYLPGGHSQTMSETGGQLAYAIFEGCATQEDFFFLFEKLKGAVKTTVPVII